MILFLILHCKTNVLVNLYWDYNLSGSVAEIYWSVSFLFWSDFAPRSVTDGQDIAGSTAGTLSHFFPCTQIQRLRGSPGFHDNTMSEHPSAPPICPRWWNVGVLFWMKLWWMRMYIWCLKPPHKSLRVLSAYFYFLPLFCLFFVCCFLVCVFSFFLCLSLFVLLDVFSSSVPSSCFLVALLFCSVCFLFIPSNLLLLFPKRQFFWYALCCIAVLSGCCKSHILKHYSLSCFVICSNVLFFRLVFSLPHFFPPFQPFSGL